MTMALGWLAISLVAFVHHVVSEFEGFGYAEE